VATRRALGASVMIAGLAGMLASGYVVPAGPGASTLASASAATLVFVASFNSNSFQFHAGFALFLNYLGSRSYMIYLWHLLLFSLCQFVWLAAWPTIIGSPSFGIGAIIALSAHPAFLVIEFSYRVIERPSRLFGHRLAARMGPGTPSPAG
jgi:peptidoglycan/LPS O-acetylase OafA/YrhL